MTHHPHTAHPNYDPRQIWFDGCAECHVRSLGLPMTMMELDAEQFREAWLRAFWWQHDDDTSLHLSETETPLLKQLWAIQVMLERFYGWPVGTFPENPDRGQVGAPASLRAMQAILSGETDGLHGAALRQHMTDLTGGAEALGPPTGPAHDQ